LWDSVVILAAGRPVRDSGESDWQSDSASISLPRASQPANGSLLRLALGTGVLASSCPVMRLTRTCALRG
ncbi:MAG: hypothetical protein M3O09_05270, partial [Acidobacteriota bacterium]|nr:hypothetical protein [Acidobacteriota bacterium]